MCTLLSIGLCRSKRLFECVQRIRFANYSRYASVHALTRAGKARNEPAPASYVLRDFSRPPVGPEGAWNCLLCQYKVISASLYSQPFRVSIEYIVIIYKEIMAKD